MGCLIAGLGFGWADDEQIWKEYLAWYRQQPIGISDLSTAYAEHLKSLGLDAGTVRERLNVVERLSKTRRAELHPFFFDRTYSSGAPRFNTAPNALLVETVRDLKPGRALDIHMGEGRNALFLASKGWDVTGFDFSEAGVAAAKRAAERAGVSVTALVCRHEDFDFGRAQWDLVVMSYTWVPLRGADYVGRIIESLKPGGILVFEHMMDDSGSPGAAPWLPRPNELLRVFGRLRIRRYEDVRARADWSWREERVARLVAERTPVPPDVLDR
ncbi:MAG TPA: methyltransferase domain-containing protein [Bryobacteraceae bacterium]|nr:methyltransferase domain-containing protein [Bryobacteraceae bacterium]HPU73318.1 methyltransferase domain-containing protein [Bryobacteraceae bacterium]